MSPSSAPVNDAAPDVSMAESSAKAPQQALYPPAAALISGVWHCAHSNEASPSKAYALAISERGTFELWEQSVTATGVELRGIGGSVSLIANSTTTVDAADTLGVVRFTKIAERLVLPAGAQETRACEAQSCDGTLLSVPESCATQVALEICAFGAYLLFWRAL